MIHRAAALFVVCGLSACVGLGDRSLAEERVSMSEAQAALIAANPDCSAMSRALADWYTANRAAVDANDLWWNALSESQQELASAGLGARDQVAFRQRMSAIIVCGSVSWFSDRHADPLAPIAAPAPVAPVFVAATPRTGATLGGAAVAPDALVIPDTAPRRGSQSPRVVIHLFSELESPFAARLAPTLDRLMEQYGDRVLLVFRHDPLPFHRHAEPAARAAMEVRAQLGDDAFWAYCDVLYAHPHELEDANLVEYASQFPGLDAERFASALVARAHASEIADDVAVARELGITGAPSMRIGSTVLGGAQPYDTIRAAVDAELAR